MSSLTIIPNYDERISIRENSSLARVYSTLDGFNYIGGSSELQKVIDKRLGYVYYGVDIYKTSFTSASDLYLVKLYTNFTPGYNAKLVEGSYYYEYFLSEGYANIGAYQYYKDSSHHGGEIKLKAYWPEGENITTKISSSYSTTYSINSEISAGVNISSGATLSASIGGGLALNYDKEIEITYNEPLFRVGVNSNHPDKRNWTYEFTDNIDVHQSIGKLPYTLNIYYLFEMSRTNIGCSASAFMLDVGLYMKNVKYGLFDIKTYSDKDYEVEISCFI